MLYSLIGDDVIESRNEKQAELTLLINKYDIKNTIFVALNQKLIIDGYVTPHESLPNTVVITLQGILFLDSGGYVQRRKDEGLDQIKKYTTNILLITGSVGAAAYFVLEWYKYYHCGCH